MVWSQFFSFPCSTVHVCRAHQTTRTYARQNRYTPSMNYVRTDRQKYLTSQWPQPAMCFCT